MGAVATAATTLDTDIATFATDLATFIAAIATSRASIRSQTVPDGPAIENSWAQAIMQKMMHYTAFQQLFNSADLPEAINRYAQGGIAGNASPTTTLNTVFSAY